jgi:hypothetical protein
MSRPPAGQVQRRDPNEGDIVEALKAHGAVVWRNRTRGMPDLTVGFDGRILMLEVKRPAGKRGGKSGSGQRLNTDQAKTFELCRTRHLPVYVVTNIEEALAALKGETRV